jgi:hypothetical protein
VGAILKSSEITAWRLIRLLVIGAGVQLTAGEPDALGGGI